MNTQLFCESLGTYDGWKQSKYMPKRFDVGFVEQYLGRIIDDLYRRFDSKFEVDEETDCWNWTGSMDNKGYGRVTFFKSPRQAYRVAYELYVGSIPRGMVLDHLCRNPSCVNPQHLEPVTPAENTRRGKAREMRLQKIAAKTHCKNGHPLEQGKSQRICRVCRNDRKRQLSRIFGTGPNLSGLRLGAAASSSARKSRTHCKRGHEFTPENTGKQIGGRYCKACDNMRSKKAS